MDRYSLNVAGDFYVAKSLCMACMAPNHEAPNLMAYDELADGSHCYFKRQPDTSDEVEQAVMAVAVGCCGAVRYAGTDPTILRRLAELGIPEACDHAEPNMAPNGGG